MNRRLGGRRRCWEGRRTPRRRPETLDSSSSRHAKIWWMRRSWGWPRRRGGAAGVGAVAGAVAGTTRGVAVERAGGGGARAVAWVICPAGEGCARGSSGAARLARADDEVRPVGSALAEGVLVERAEFALGARISAIVASPASLAPRRRPPREASTDASELAVSALDTRARRASAARYANRRGGGGGVRARVVRVARASAPWPRSTETEAGWRRRGPTEARWTTLLALLFGRRRRFSTEATGTRARVREKSARDDRITLDGSCERVRPVACSISACASVGSGPCRALVAPSDISRHPARSRALFRRVVFCRVSADASRYC